VPNVSIVPVEQLYFDTHDVAWRRNEPYLGI